MAGLEAKMRFLRNVFEDLSLSREVRRAAFERYKKLHAQRTPDEVYELEKKAGLQWQELER